MKKRFCLLLLTILWSLILTVSEAENLVKKLPDANSARFKEATIYEPFGNDRIRLAGDSDRYNGGLVKVFRNKTWGYVCDDDWDIKDANVACRQLGFNRGAAKFVSASWYGEAENGLYLMDDVKCAGDEKQLQKCSYNIHHNCDKNEAAGVICNLNTGCEDQWISGPTGCYRLFDGSFTRYNAENKCKSLNGHLVKIETQEENNFLSSILRMWKETHYWLTDGIKEQNWIWKTDGKPISPSFWFPGWEPQSQFPKPSNNTLKNCLALANAFKYKDSKYLSEYFYWHDINCNTVGNFICETEKTETPSADEPSKCSVNEMYCASSHRCIPLIWKCDGENDCPGGEDETNCEPIKCRVNEMHCASSDSCILSKWKCDGDIDCPGGEDETNCEPIKCRVNEMYCASSHRCILSKWKCDGDIDCPGGEDETNCEPIQCSVNEMYCASSHRCILSKWKCDGDNDCPGGEDETNCAAVIKLELVGGSSELSGRIEISRNGVKGTVCDDEFDDNDAKVVCRMMGHSSGEVIPNIFGYGEGTIWLDELNCTGSEYNLEVCPNLSWEVHNCTHKEDVAIKCFKEANTTSITPTSSTDQNDIKVELVGGSSELSGRIEITHNGTRGTVCDDEFDDNDAKVICRMMGHSSGEVIPNIFGYGEGTIWLDELNCTGSEYDLEVCPNLSWEVHDCTHKEDVAIKCFKEANTTTRITPTSSKDHNDIKVELVGGSSELSGRIEITHNGTRGTVCDDEFDDNDAKVICRMMGHSSGEVIPNIFGYGEGTIWLDELNCTGSEYDLEVCPNLSWEVHDCTHKEDVAIKCFKEANTTTRITPTSSKDQNVTCGKRPIKPRYQRFPGGYFARYGAFPWQARILNASFVGKLHHCGAAIINKFWLLTAAHCFKNNSMKENMLLHTGDLNSKNLDAHEQSFQAEHLIVHPSYDSLTNDYDVALIKLQPDRNGNGIVFNDYVQPVCLPPQNLNISSRTYCEISGWGSTGQIYSIMLKAATVPLIPRHICEVIYKDITSRMLCAGYLQGGIDTCQGDNGGPLVCSINGVFTLIGITSSGNDCTRPYNPGVYTNVAYLKPWIMATIAKYS